MSTTARVRLPRERRIADTLLAARAVFEQHGYEAAAMSEIASRVGVVEGALYRFFASKWDLLIAVTCKWYEEIMTPLREGLATRSTVRDRLHFVVWHHLMCIHSSPKLINLFFNLVRMNKQYVSSELFEYNKYYVNLIGDILREGIASQEFRCDLPIELVRNMVFGMAEQQSWAYRCGHGPLDVDKVADDITDLVFTACRITPCEPVVSDDAAADIARLAQKIQALATGGAQGGAS